MRDDNKHGFIVLMALATASVTVLFQVLVGGIKAVFSFLGITGFILLIPVFIWMKQNKEKIDALIKELGELNDAK